MTMIENVAAAIEKAELGNNWEAQARAAIEAMREPTEAMLKTEMDLGGHGFCDGECDQADPLDVWQAMIDEALKTA